MKAKELTTGQRIRAAREAAKLTGTQLAVAAGTSHSAISDYELGKREPELPTLRRIAAALGVRWQDLVETTTKASAKTTTKRGGRGR